MTVLKCKLFQYGSTFLFSVFNLLPEGVVDCLHMISYLEYVNNNNNNNTITDLNLPASY